MDKQICHIQYPESYNNIKTSSPQVFYSTQKKKKRKIGSLLLLLSLVHTESVHCDHNCARTVH